VARRGPGDLDRRRCRLRPASARVRARGPARSHRRASALGPDLPLPPKHGSEFALAKPATWPEPAHTTSTETERYGTAVALAWDRLHPRLTHRTCWLEHDGKLPVIEGTLIRLEVEHLPGERDPRPVWLWASMTGTDTATVDRLWQAYLRRFDLEHTFRMLKQTLGWTRPRLRDPRAADRWTWLVLTAHTQLRLARPLAADLRRPWEKPAAPERLTPARVRRGFRNIRATSALPARVPKRPSPGPDARPVPQSTPCHQPARRQDPLPGEVAGRTTPTQTLTEGVMRQLCIDAAPVLPGRNGELVPALGSKPHIAALELLESCGDAAAHQLTDLDDRGQDSASHDVVIDGSGHVDHESIVTSSPAYSHPGLAKPPSRVICRQETVGG